MTDGLHLEPTTVRVVDPGLADRVAAPGADVVPAAERRALAAREPLSWLHAMQTAAEHGGDRDRALAACRRAVERLLAADVFGPATGPRHLLYRLATGTHVQTGLVAEVPVAAYRAGLLLRHERTLVDRQAELAAYRRHVGVASSPTALAAHVPASLRAIEARVVERRPVLDLATPEGVRHTLWSIDRRDEVDEVRAATAGVDRAWIVDGHHRLAAAAAVAADATGPTAADPTRSVLCVVFGLDELRVLPFHRVVALALEDDQLRARLATVGTLSPLEHVAACDDRRSWAIHVGGEWCRLTLAAADPPDPADDDALDVVTLHGDLLEPVLGIEHPRTDPRLTHVAGGPDEVAAAAARPGTIGVLVRPVPIDRLTALAAAGVVLPPKSTRFAPKVRSGLLLRHLR